MPNLSFDKAKLNILLLEGVHPKAIEMLKHDGYTTIESLPAGLDAASLEAKLSTDNIHILGIRSRSHITPEVIKNARKLMAIGCFCIGTNQVALPEAARRGIPVFNAPYANTRSVAELVIAEAILLMRGIPEKNAALHQNGQWLKSAAGSHEIRGKTLGIIGYGNIGTQVGLLAEALGMKVVYFDTARKLSLGTAQPAGNLEELFAHADVVTLHVPADATTKNMIGKAQLSNMKKGAHLINAARGNIIVIDDLVEALKSGHIGGAALDVFPAEPKEKGALFESPLRDFPNVILTPHIGGSTQEAQENIGLEVAEKFITYSNTGDTMGAVNFPQVNLPQLAGRRRILHIHENKPGVLKTLNDFLADLGLNIAGQYLQTTPDVGYVVTDVDSAEGMSLPVERLKALEGTLKARVLY